MDSELLKLITSGSILTTTVTICAAIVRKLYNDMRDDHQQLMDFLNVQTEINSKVSSSLENVFNEIKEIKNIVCKKE